MMQNGFLFDKIKDTDVCLQLPRNLFIDKRLGNCLVLDPAKPDWFFCSEDLIPLFKIIDGKRTINKIRQEAVKVYGLDLEKIDFFLKFLIHELFVISASDFDPNTQIKDMLLDMVYLYITSRCNQKCIYCYRPDNQEENDDMSIDDIKASVREIALMNPNATVVITGGEPLLHRDILKICEVIKNQGLRIEINTNGSLILKYPQLIELVDLFNISLDSSRKEIHEQLRGKGTYLRTQQAVSFLEENGAEVVITPTFTCENIEDIPKLFLKYKNTRCSFKSNVFTKMGRGKNVAELSVNPEDLCKVSRQLSQHASYISKASKDFLPKRFKRKISCGMGVRYMSIESDGNVYPCQMMHVDSCLMGNIRQSSLEEIYWHSPVSELCRGLNVEKYDECKSCEIKYICGGGCRARALFEKASLNRADGLCVFWKDVYIRCLWNDAPQELYINAYTSL